MSNLTNSAYQSTNDATYQPRLGPQGVSGIHATVVEIVVASIVAVLVVETVFVEAAVIGMIEVEANGVELKVAVWVVVCRSIRCKI